MTMSETKERFAERLQMEEEDLPFLRANASDEDKNKNGSASNVLAGAVRYLGVANYVLHHDVETFKTHLSEAATYRLKLFERFDQGDPISRSYLSMLSYKALFSALGAGDMDLAKSLASRMGGRDEIEREHDHIFDRTLGYALKAFVLGDKEAMHERAETFSKECEKKGNTYFRGYAHVFDAILEGNSDKANSGFAELISGHRKMCTGRGIFKDSEDEVLCVWGLGLANLAISHGLALNISDPLIPSDLII